MSRSHTTENSRRKQNERHNHIQNPSYQECYMNQASTIGFRTSALKLLRGAGGGHIKGHDPGVLITTLSQSCKHSQFSSNFTEMQALSYMGGTTRVYTLQYAYEGIAAWRRPFLTSGMHVVYCMQMPHGKTSTTIRQTPMPR